MTLNVSRSFRLALACLAAIAIALLAWPLAAQHTPSKPFLEKTAFYLRSAGFNIRFANDNPAGERALKTLPPHRFVIHKFGSVPRYVYADPGVCNCIFTGTRDNYESYLAILRQPVPGVADVSPDYKTEASALLMEQPVDFGTVNPEDTLADYFRDYL